MKQPAIYILSNIRHTVFYTGVTSNLAQRIWQHKEGVVEGFTKRYRCKELLYYEVADTMEAAILREKQIKDYRREKKKALIDTLNPEWKDLYNTII
jgi:putative endonuclease